MWQDAPGWTVKPWQSCEPPKTPAAPPAPDITADVREVFVIVIRCRELCPPTGTAPKDSAVGEIRNRSIPLPTKLNANGWPFQFPLVEPFAIPSASGVKA